MAYTGSLTPNTGTDTLGALNRDVFAGVLAAYKRNTIFADKISTRIITGGTGAQFIVEGKEDTVDTNVATYAAGAQVDVTGSTQDELIINLDRPQYIARRIDKFDEAVASYDVVPMNLNQIGAKMANVIDRKSVAGIEAASLATGLVSNGNGTVVVNTALLGGVAAATTPAGLGDEIVTSVYAAIAALQENDDFNEIYVAMSPTNFQYLPQSLNIVSTDFSGANGGLDTGIVKMIGGAKVYSSNNMPATAGLIALAWTPEAAGCVKLWDVKTKITEQPDFLDAKLITAHFSNGIAALRPQSSVSIKNV
jgi:hypothetical protein